MKIKGKLSIAIVCVFVGILIILSMKAVNELGGSANSERAAQLASELSDLELKNQELNTRIEEQNKTIARYEVSSADDSSLVSQRLAELEEERITAGLVSVSGPGLVITVETSTAADYDANLYASNSELLLSLVNELNAAGAEAISINGERLINTSEIREAGAYVNINRNKTSAPFEVKVVGDSTTLAAAIEMRSGIVDTMKANRLSVTVLREEQVSVDAYNGTVEVKYATPITQDDAGQ